VRVVTILPTQHKENIRTINFEKQAKGINPFACFFV